MALRVVTLRADAETIATYVRTLRQFGYDVEPADELIDFTHNNRVIRVPSACAVMHGDDTAVILIHRIGSEQFHLQIFYGDNGLRDRLPESFPNSVILCRKEVVKDLRSCCDFRKRALPRPEIGRRDT